MKKIIFLFALLSTSFSLFGQREHSSILVDSIQKLPISDTLVGKWVLVSSKSKKNHEDDMEQWNIQTIEFKKDRTLVITPGKSSGKTIYWSYNKTEKSLVIFSSVEGNKLTSVKFPILKMTETQLVTPEWINTKLEDKHYMKLTFLKVE
jgi:hypothetical protein